MEPIRAVLIHSPGSGGADAVDVQSLCERLQPQLHLSVRAVSEQASPRVLAEQAVAEGVRLLIACGGDGTVSAVGGVASDTPGCRLGILPTGTANSIANWLEIPSDLEGALAVLLRGQTRVIDTARVNGRPMLLMAGVGIHGDAITQVDPDLKKRLGPLAYVVEELGRFASDEPFEAQLWADGAEESLEVSAITVANIARKATLLAQGPAEVTADDGLLSLTAVSTRGFADAIATTFHLATTALSDAPAERDNILHVNAREIRIATAEPRRVMVDGEDAMQTPITLRCLPSSLTVLVP